MCVAYYPDLPGWDPTWEKRFPEMYGYDPAAAKRLLAEAGYPKGFKAKAWLYPFAGAPELIPLMEVGASPVARGGHRAGAGRGRPGGNRLAQDAGPQSQWYICRASPSKKAVEAQISLFNAGKGTAHQFETDEIYKMWEDLLQMSDPKAADAQLRKIGNYKFENFEIIPLFDVYIEVVVTPRSSRTGRSPAGTVATLATPGSSSACKQEKPCK